MKYQLNDSCKYFITYGVSDRKNICFDALQKEIINTQLFVSAEETDIIIDAFAILNNHLHFIISCAEQPQRKEFLKLFAGRSSRFINETLGREGILWDKYYAWGLFIEKAYFNVLYYILSNPIQHGVVKSFENLYNYCYCSYEGYVDK